nr:protein SUPPRESSOR OF PHYA-105 1-like isoform X2 [Lolium perenne]
MEGTTAAEAGSGAVGDAQIKPLPQQPPQPSGSEALEMPATPLPVARELDWSEHFSFFNSEGGTGATDGARPADSVTQHQRHLDSGADERVEELTVRNCISSEAQPEAPAAGSSGGGERPVVMRGLWGNFTRMAWRTGDAASREALLAASRGDTANASRDNLAASRGDNANLRSGDLVSRENLPVNLGNGMISHNIDASSAKEMLFSRGENATNMDFSMSFGSQQQQQHILSSRLNQSEQQQHILSSRPNQSEQQQHILSSRLNQSEQQQHILSSRPSQSEQQQHILSSRPSQSEQQQHILSSRPNQGEQQHHILSSRPNQGEQQRSERENGMKMSSFSNRIIDQMRSKTVAPPSGVQGSPFKNGLKGKGVSHQAAREEMQLQANARSRAPIPKIPSSTNDSVTRLDGAFFNTAAGSVSESQHEGTSLRELIKPARQAMSKFEKMHLFKQILDHVDKCHAQGLTLQHLRPSYFIVTSPNQVKYTGSYTTQDLSAPAKPEMAADEVFNRKRFLDQKTVLQESNGNGNSILKYQKVGEQGSVAIRRPIHAFRTDHRGGNQREGADLGASGQGNSSCTARGRFKFGEPYYGSNASYAQRLSNYGNQESVLEPRVLEDSWYRSPEELSQLKGTFPSNIYSLGVLLFELFCCCETWEQHCAAMSDLRHRILPPSFLSESPREAGFCLWLVHPDPCSRPKAKDIQGCDLINEGRDLSLLDKEPAAVNEDDTESGLLLNFLSQLKEEKEMQAAKLSADLASLQTDIVEADRRHSLRMGFTLEDMDALASSNDVPGTSSNALRGGALLSGAIPPSGRPSIYEERVMRNLEQLENAYYSMRSTIDTSDTNVIKRPDNDALRVRENFSQLHRDTDVMDGQTDRLGCFFDGLCKYARHSRFEVRGILKNADILSSPNVICSLSFDRDEEYFATAGVSKKIKIFEFDALLNDRVDIHYPLVEMPSKSKLSCVSWNNYIKNYLASTDYDGTVQLWDASTGQGFTQFTEHRKRAWSVSFSEVDPTKLASGSDDCCVKVWSINQKNCVDTIRNVANVCCVQFSPYSSRMLAFGSADYKTYCYDLRHTRIPWCTISGHGKAVSYVRFLDPETLISASTDNTLKIWDLNQTNSSGLSTNACSLTLSGHTNEKNFVGLSVHDGYITCGSENNEVYSYYKTFPMPITSHKFGSIDPITGQETNDDNQQFVSSVCWRGRSNMVVAANSSGSIKVLELV